MTRTRPPLRIPPQPGRPTVEAMQQRYAGTGLVCELVKHRTGYYVRAVEDDQGNRYESLADAGRACGVNYQNISNALAGNQKTAGGRRWRYAKGKR